MSLPRRSLAVAVALLAAACTGSQTTSPPSGPVDWSGKVQGEVGDSGGVVSRLYFAVIGDTRPKNPDDVADYPKPVIARIYGDIASLSPEPAFGIATGDYMFATPGRGTALAQLKLYEQAESVFPNPVFHALGNHECTGYTASDCGTGNKDGLAENFQAYMDEWVRPLGYSHPYYSLSFTGSDGSWTAKIVVVAANAWDATEATWLDQALAVPSTFTFVVRHEPGNDYKSPGAKPSEAIIRRHPLTLELVGHVHHFDFQTSSKELVVGNGGAPLSGGDYGYATISQIAPDKVVVSQFDYSSPMPSRTWTVDADGTVH